MFLKSTLLAGLSLLTLTSAHFRITYPADRGESEGDESKDPCGGASVSSERTPWPISGGRVSFEAGHDEAETHVLLYVGENPTKNDDFNITLAPAFNQIGLGNFCWEKVGVPKGAAEIKNGTKATIQMRQYGDEKTWLYNCADIIFVSNPPTLSSKCENDTGITAEPLSGGSNSGSGNSTGGGSGGSGAPGLQAKIGAAVGAAVLGLVVAIL